MMSHLEKCDAEKSPQTKKRVDPRTGDLQYTEETQAEAQRPYILMAITMIYEDILRVRPLPGVGGALHCMNRIGGF